MGILLHLLQQPECLSPLSLQSFSTTVQVAVGAKVVVLKSLKTGTADDLCALDTLWNVSVVGLSSLLYTPFERDTLQS